MPTWEIASDIGPRLGDLRRAMGWDVRRLYDELGLGRSRGAEYLHAPNAAGLSAAPLDRLLRRYNWPRAMFQPGGPMPSTIVSRPVNGADRWRSYLDRLPDFIARGDDAALLGFLLMWVMAIREALQQAEDDPAEPNPGALLPVRVRPSPAFGSEAPRVEPSGDSEP